MSALAEALVAAQARACAAIAKAYVAGDGLPDEAVKAALDSMGLTDVVEQGQWIMALTVLKAHGGPAPTEAKPSPNGPDRSKATQAQIDLMRKIAGERNYVLPDDPQLLTRDQASSVIDSMKAGEYDQAAWAVPF